MELFLAKMAELKNEPNLDVYNAKMVTRAQIHRARQLSCKIRNRAPEHTFLRGAQIWVGDFQRNRAIVSMILLDFMIL